MEPPSPLPPPSQSASSSPLADFQRIGHNTFLWTPSSYHANPSPETPLILVFSWNGAALKHIAKYTSTYQALFPHARILLVTCFTRDMFRRSTSYPILLAPALDVVSSHTSNSGGGGDILCHSFSNGGGNQIPALQRGPG
ncbi:indole-diterpene biosynthesis protein [Stemphylium lycopersici]|nr:indole-diterpene biosynthesis protein [Stemphylium lycopersici]